MKHLKSFNESVKDFLKPKSKEDVELSLKNLPIDKKLWMIYIYHLEYVYTDKEIKELHEELKKSLEKLSPTKKLWAIDKYKLTDVYTNEEIKKLFKNYTADNKIGHIIDFKLADIFTDQELLDLINRSKMKNIDILYLGIEYNRIEIVKYVLKKGVDVNFEGISRSIRFKGVDIWSHTPLEFACAKSNDIEIIRLLMYNGATTGDSIEIAQKVKRDDIVKLLRGLSSYNESVKDFLKPKSTENILKSLKGKDNKYIFYKLIENGIDVPDEIKNSFKRYFRIADAIYMMLYKEVIPFTEEEKYEIDLVIHRSKKSDNYYEFNKPIGIEGNVSLYINSEEEEYKISNFKDHILIIHNKEELWSHNYVTEGYFVCQNIDQLVEFLDDYAIYANKRK